MKNTAKYLAEFLGTFVLSFIVVLSVAKDFPVSTPMLATITLLIFVYTIGPISGCHINPAVTVGLWVREKIKLQEAVMYILVQLVAGVVAMYAVKSLGGEINIENIFGNNVFFAEMLGSAVFGFGIMAVVRKKTESTMSGVVIGGSLLLGIVIAVLAGSAGVLNPAVALAFGFADWQYLTSSVVGMVLGMVLYDFLIGEKLANLKITFAEKKD